MTFVYSNYIPIVVPSINVALARIKMSKHPYYNAVDTDNIIIRYRYFSSSNLRRLKSLR